MLTETRFPDGNLEMHRPGTHKRIAELETQLAAQAEALTTAQQQVADADARSMVHNAGYWGASQRADEAQQREQQARAEATALRQSLMNDCWGHRETPDFECIAYGCNQQEGHLLPCPIAKALSTTAGKDLADEVARLRTFVAAIRQRWDCQSYPGTVHCCEATCDPTDRIVCETLAAYDKAKEGSGGCQ